MRPRIIPREGVDKIDYEGGSVAIGRFRCEVGHPEFRDTGPIRRSIVVFPRTSVWIRHEGGREFVADPNVVTIYNRGQRYRRRAISTISRVMSRHTSRRRRPTTPTAPSAMSARRGARRSTLGSARSCGARWPAASHRSERKKK